MSVLLMCKVSYLPTARMKELFICPVVHVPANDPIAGFVHVN